MESLKAAVRNIPDFPKEGIQFKDLTTLFQDGKAFKRSLDLIAEHYKGQKIDKVAGVESRGFILGGAIADRLECGFVTVRKKGKLPWKTISQDYSLEYGESALEVHIDAVEKGEKILVVDDLLATGGTLEATIKLIEELGGEIAGVTCIIELLGLNGRERLKDYPLHCLLAYDEA
ncbi:MAG: adenine phosphoribosyltransferase [bacterium]|jgi:adenine phosphoribosyltransferase